MDYNPGDPAGTPPPPQYPPAQPSSGLSQNSAAALAYVFLIPAIIFLVMEPYNKNPFIRFHSFQSIAFCVVTFALSLLFIALDMIPILGWLLHIFFIIGVIVVWLLVLLKASKGEWYKLPLIGDFALTQSRS